MKYLRVFLVAVIVIACSEEKKPLLGETDYQKQQNAFFKDASTSPLTDKDREHFEGLDFFKFDSTYIVQARLIETPDEQPFKMKTTTGRLPLYRKYGEIYFKMKDQELSLNIYKNMEEDYLFLPFLDDTNGETTYGGGRYIEMPIPQNSVMTINFNQAFNPYCVYNKKYSCPIVPRENYLATKIEAGVKDYKKS